MSQRRDMGHPVCCDNNGRKAKADSPEGMTERKAKATAGAKATADPWLRSDDNSELVWMSEVGMDV
jgi:hypothetical protein